MLLLVMLFSIASSTLYIHSHIYKGHEIVHSHPTSTTSHSHSDSSFDTINRINTTESTSVEVATIEVFTQPYTELDFAQYACIEKLGYQAIHSLRAPPAVA